MNTPFAIMTVACIGAFPISTHARPHHSHHPATPPIAREAYPPLFLSVQGIAFRPSDDRPSSERLYVPGAVGGNDRIPMSAANRFGRGGVASIGYEPGASRSLVEPHELNAVFSTRPTTVGSVVGAGVSIQF
jgi:hypothetical protein